jgi:hypothetical protein
MRANVPSDAIREMPTAKLFCPALLPCGLLLAILLASPAAQCRRVYDDPNSFIGLDFGQRFNPDVVDPFIYPVAGFFGSILLWDDLIARLNIELGYSYVRGSPLGFEEANLATGGLIFDLIWGIPVARETKILVGWRLGYRYTCVWADHDLRPAGSTGATIKISDYINSSFGALLGVLLPLRDGLWLSVEGRIEYSPTQLLNQDVNAGGYSAHAALWWKFATD